MSETEQDPNAQPNPPEPAPPPPNPEDVAEAAFLAYIRTKWTEPVVCPVCKTTKWHTGAVVDLPIRYRTNRVYSMVPVRCGNCAYTLLFHGNAIGLFDEKGEPIPYEAPAPAPAPEPKPKPEPGATGEESA